MKEVDQIAQNILPSLTADFRQLQDNSEKWRYCWLFEIGSMRNAHLKTVRKLWKEYVDIVLSVMSAI